MSTHNIGFYEDLTKIIFELSSNTHLISSADLTSHFSTYPFVPAGTYFHYHNIKIYK